MHAKLLLRCGVVALLACASSLCTAAATAAGPRVASTPALHDQLQSVERDLAILKETSVLRLDAQDKRLADISHSTAQHGIHVEAVGNYIAWTSGAITLVVFLAGFSTYFSAKRRAQEEARQSAKLWFADNAMALVAEIEQLRQQSAHASSEIEGHSKAVADRANSAQQRIDEAAKTILDKTSAGLEERIPIATSAAAATVVQEQSIALRAKPETSFSPEDHYTRGLSHYSFGRFDSALVSFEEALSSLQSAGDASTLQRARILYAKAMTLGQLDRSEDAIEVYNEIDRRFGKDESPAVREQVARALVNKGFRLGKLDKSEDAIEVYDEIDRRFGKDESPALRERVARALVGKGITLGKLDKSEDEIEVYNEIDRRFGKDESPAVREQVARARNVRGYRSILLAKKVWQVQPDRERHLSNALDALQRATEIAAMDTIAMVWGNLGYCQFLMGETATARTSTIKCLRAGGQESLETQRNDTKIARVDSVDAQYEEFLAACWNELKDSATK